jgi:hypothetical protein
MPFLPGQPKPIGSGRRKGSQNLKKVPKVSEYLASKGINPVEELIELMPGLMPGQQMQVWLELLKYCQPSFRPIDATLEPDEDESIVAEMSESELIAAARGENAPSE